MKTQNDEIIWNPFFKLSSLVSFWIWSVNQTSVMSIIWTTVSYELFNTLRIYIVGSNLVQGIGGRVFHWKFWRTQKLSHPNPTQLLSSLSFARYGVVWGVFRPAGILWPDQCAATRMAVQPGKTWQMFPIFLTEDFSPDLLHRQGCGLKKSASVSFMSVKLWVNFQTCPSSFYFSDTHIFPHGSRTVFERSFCRSEIQWERPSDTFERIVWRVRRLSIWVAWSCVDGAALLCGRGVCGCKRFVEGKQTFVLDRRRSLSRHLGRGTAAFPAWLSYWPFGVSAQRHKTSKACFRFNCVWG